MMFRGSGTRFPSQPRLALVLVSFAAVAGFSSANGQTATPDTADGNQEVQRTDKSSLPPLARNKFDPVQFMSPTASHYFLHPENPAPPQYIFFPPVPPNLDSEIPALDPYYPGPPAPPELEAFIGEIFYPLLGTRLASEDLPKPLRARIVAYRNTKVGLQEALRAKILALKDADHDAQVMQLETFANQQAPKILELDASEEQLRVDLRPARVLGLQVEGTDPSGRLGRRMYPVRNTPQDPVGLARESDAIRAAAFFQEGLSLLQRRLLLEAAAELESKINPNSVTSQVASGMRLVFFSPETSRIPIPESLPEALEGRVREYLTAKNALKDELRDALAETVSAPENTRRETLANLAVMQAPRIVRVETLAEEIRLELAAIPSPRGSPAAVALPPELAARISDYRKHKLELLRTLRALLVSPTRQGEATRNPQTKEQTDTSNGTLAWLHDSSTRTEIQSSNLRVTVAEFDHRQNELISALNMEEAGIRVSLAAFVRSAGGPTDSKSVNDLLRDFEGARQRQEISDRYRDYQAAVLLPGLSPGQRRLLFDAAIEQLALPLPGGERAN